MRYVIIGHSERRQYFEGVRRDGEPQDACGAGRGASPHRLRRRDVAAARVGHVEESARDATGKGGLAMASTRSELADIILAYEPGLGHRHGQAGHARAGGGGPPVHPPLAELAEASTAWPRPTGCASSTAVVSSPENAAELLNQPNIDGALVGGREPRCAGLHRHHQKFLPCRLDGRRDSGRLAVRSGSTLAILRPAGGAGPWACLADVPGSSSMQRSKQEGLGAAFGGGFLTESVWGAQTSNVSGAEGDGRRLAAHRSSSVSIGLARLYSSRAATCLQTGLARAAGTASSPD